MKVVFQDMVVLNTSGVEAMQQARTPTKTQNKVPMVKSPSDTTIYAPAIQRNQGNVNVANNDVTVDTELINRISDFVAQMRIEADNGQSQVNGTVEPQLQTSDGRVVGGDMDNNKACEISNQIILDAEKFRATINDPQGMCMGDGNKVEQVPQLVYPQSTIDDEFFHITCHIDENLKSKIRTWASSC